MICVRGASEILLTSHSEVVAAAKFLGLKIVVSGGGGGGALPEGPAR